MRRAFLFLLAAALLTVPIFADSGPKPQLIVRVENAPEELYYLDILAEGACPYPDAAVGGLEGSYSKAEYAALDQDLLSDLTAAIPEDWFGCVTQGKLVWGNIDSKDGYHSFSYIGVPDVCRILMVTKSGEVFLSEPFDRQALQSSVTVDWAAKTVKAPPIFAGYAAQFLATFLPTLAVEGVLLLLFRLWSKRNGLVFLLVNLATQGGLTLWMSVRTVRGGVFASLGSWLWELSYFLRELPASIGEGSLANNLMNFLYCFRLDYYLPRRLIQGEIVVFLVETGLYLWLFRDCSKKRAVLYGLTANLGSFLLGWYLAEPVWRFVVNTIL